MSIPVALPVSGGLGSNPFGLPVAALVGNHGGLPVNSPPRARLEKEKKVEGCSLNDVEFVSLGMTNVDDIVYSRRVKSKSYFNVLGGGGVHAAHGMRMFSRNVAVASVVGHDWAELVPLFQKHLDNHGINRLLFASLSAKDRPTNRTWCLYDQCAGGVDNLRCEWKTVEKPQAPLSIDPSHVAVIAAALPKLKGIHLCCPLERAVILAAELKKNFKDCFVLWEPVSSPSTARSGDETKDSDKGNENGKDVEADNKLKLLEEVFQHINLFSPNASELARIFPFLTFEAQAPMTAVSTDWLEGVAVTFQSLGCKDMVIRLGSQGSAVIPAAAPAMYRVPAYPLPAHAVADVTGCGNTYCGAFLVSYVQYMASFKNVSKEDAAYIYTQCGINASVAASFCAEEGGPMRLTAEALHEKDLRRDALMAIVSAATQSQQDQDGIGRGKDGKEAPNRLARKDAGAIGVGVGAGVGVGVSALSSAQAAAAAEVRRVKGAACIFDTSLPLKVKVRYGQGEYVCREDRIRDSLLRGVGGGFYPAGGEAAAEWRGEVKDGGLEDREEVDEDEDDEDGEGGAHEQNGGALEDVGGGMGGGGAHTLIGSDDVSRLKQLDELARYTAKRTEARQRRFMQTQSRKQRRMVRALQTVSPQLFSASQFRSHLRPLVHLSFTLKESASEANCNAYIAALKMASGFIKPFAVLEVTVNSTYVDAPVQAGAGACADDGDERKARGTDSLGGAVLKRSLNVVLSVSRESRESLITAVHTNLRMMGADITAIYPVPLPQAREQAEGAAPSSSSSSSSSASSAPPSASFSSASSASSSSSFSSIFSSCISFEVALTVQEILRTLVVLDVLHLPPPPEEPNAAGSAKPQQGFFSMLMGGNKKKKSLLEEIGAPFPVVTIAKNLAGILDELNRVSVVLGDRFVEVQLAGLLISPLTDPFLSPAEEIRGEWKKAAEAFAKEHAKEEEQRQLEASLKEPHGNGEYVARHPVLAWVAGHRTVVFLAEFLGVVAFPTAIAGLGALTKFQRSLLYHPMKGPFSQWPDEFEMDFESVQIPVSEPFVKEGPVGANFLHAWLITQPKEEKLSAPTLVFFHGNAGTIEHRLPNYKLLHKYLKCNILAFEYRGFAQNEGKPTETALVSDAMCAIRYLRTRKDVNQVDGSLWIFGRSLGGAVAIACAHLMQEAGEEMARWLGALMLENTFTCIPDMLGPLLKQGLNQVVKDKYDSVARIRGMPPTTNVLFLSGRQDTLVPPYMMDHLYKLRSEANAQALNVFRGFPQGTHNDTWTKRGYIEALEDFTSKVKK